jgi:hypothetical protein
MQGCNEQSTICFLYISSGCSWTGHFVWLFQMSIRTCTETSSHIFFQMLFNWGIFKKKIYFFTCGTGPMCERWLLLPTERCCRGDPSVLLSDSDRDWDDFFFGRIVMMLVQRSLSLPKRPWNVLFDDFFYLFNEKDKFSTERWPCLFFCLNYLEVAMSMNKRKHRVSKCFKFSMEWIFGVMLWIKNKIPDVCKIVLKNIF